ncbi:MAG: TIGR02757 family protein [Acidobacteria bacterium]|nr:TIGR02757 family protein [Acidobacteriota bacterium]
MPKVPKVREVPGMLRTRLEHLYRTFDHVDSASDPVHMVRRYRAPDDREIAGFCAAGLAFGRVASVLASIEALLTVMGPSPAAFVRGFDPATDGHRLAALGHRWIRGKDLAALVLILQRMLREAGSIEQFFVAGDDPSTPDVGPALDVFSARALETDLRPAYGSRRVSASGPARRTGVCFFFPRPSTGSACKRLNLFLRWMVRRDAIDLGAWSQVSAARLIVPLDTHVIRLGRCLRLTRYANPGWKMAAEITAALRAIDPHDPVRYDFSLCHVGMMNACGYGRPQRDSRCPLRGLCAPHARRGRCFSLKNVG